MKSSRQQLEELVLPFFQGSDTVKRILDYRQEILLLFDYDINQETKEELHKLLTDLYIVFRDYMKPGKNYNSLQSIGLWIGVSRERVSQIEKKGLHKLKHPRYKQVFEDMIETRALYEKEKLMMSAKSL